MGTRKGTNKGTKKRRNSFGTVRQLPSGRWQARYIGLNNERFSAPHTFKHELDAYAWLANQRRVLEQQKKQEEAERLSLAYPTVGHVLAEWLEDIEQQYEQGVIRLSTLTQYRSILKTRLFNAPYLCDLCITELTPRHVAFWWREINKRYPNTPQRNKRAYSRLRAAIAGAVEEGVIQTNPVQIRAARHNVPAEEKRLPKTSELEAILEAMPDRYQVATCLCLFHGLRLGEALALQRKHVVRTETGGLAVQVEATLSRVPDKTGRMFMQRNPPKTKAGYRNVPVLAEFRSLILLGVERYTSEPEDYLTTTNNGALVMDTSFRSAFHRAKEKAGVQSDITPHYGRNWLITRLAENGATPKEIGRILGQSDVSTIVGVYMKVREQRPAELMASIDLSSA